MTKINLALEKLVENKTGGNKRKFAKMYLRDNSPTNLDNWIGGTKSPTIEKLDPLFKEIENLNLNWFFRNEGEMYLSDSRDSQLESKLKEANQEIKKQSEVIDFYKDIIKNTMKAPKEKELNFQTSNKNRQLADRILMMYLCPENFNRGLFSTNN